MCKIVITLTEVEKQALVFLSEKERRDPRAQAGLIVVEELSRKGLLTSPPVVDQLVANQAAANG